MKAILFEFPVTRVDFAIPKWTEMLPMEHKLKAAMIQTASRLMDGIGRVRDEMCIRDRPIPVTVLCIQEHMIMIP